MAVLKINRIGENHKILNGYVAEIISYNGALDLSVKLNDGTILNNVQYWNLRNGKVLNPNFKSLFGVGYLGQGKYLSSVNGKKEKFYNLWSHMLQRCYSPNEKQISYKDCSVVSEWHNFQNFAKWCSENYIDDFHLDKDILIKGNKVYGTDTCCFVPLEINIMVILNKSSRGNNLLGVSKFKGKYTSRVKINKKTTHLGYYEKEVDAFLKYKDFKEKIMKETAEKYKDKISEKTYLALINYEVSIND